MRISWADVVYDLARGSYLRNDGAERVYSCELNRDVLAWIADEY